MTRLTFGITASPYLATRIIQQITDYHQDRWPETAQVAKEQFYVDDCLTRASRVETAIQLQ